MNTEMKNIYTKACVKMANALTKAGIPFTYEDNPMLGVGGGQFSFPEFPEADITCHYGTYGAELGLFESYKFPWDADDVTGWLTPTDFIARYQQAKAEREEKI